MLVIFFDVAVFVVVLIILRRTLPSALMWMKQMNYCKKGIEEWEKLWRIFNEVVLGIRLRWLTWLGVLMKLDFIEIRRKGCFKNDRGNITHQVEEKVCFVRSVIARIFLNGKLVWNFSSRPSITHLFWLCICLFVIRWFEGQISQGQQKFLYFAKVFCKILPPLNFSFEFFCPNFLSSLLHCCPKFFSKILNKIFKKLWPIFQQISTLKSFLNSS